jgi:RNA-binding protein
VVAEIDRALTAHELIKVRAGALERTARDEALASICQKTAADPVQQVGKVFVLYRRKPDARENGSA